ncbi:phosphonate metabolism transcriptional regulator PhnF [Sinorhizobium mexicanum]|uniref:Phosphonate metabolism transcriptional regulator PhnF n=1 Tax=Sinorhizobium mexicanum TaxID=375549 RepID=A0A859QLB3_9HYPH|nr:phosphonate metabolism transcriptional regulator PhnF [Sinorhizobium mexicanum]MBP1887587.1 GntR family phosphonate transport system transcriptional regulator [Sinorhizobium mexicanum]QLL63330.1 phosphonate metabolism transcriptional regulator PhnF [Sinorhizobium mexicanum]
MTDTTLTQAARLKRGQWQLIEEQVSRDIASGVLAPMAKLPTETEIMQRFGVGRHTVRRAIAELAAAGKLRVEQGRGTFVEEQSVIRYNIARRTRFSKNLRDQGRTPSGQPVEEMEVGAPPVVAAALQVPDGSPVYMIVRRGFADDVPISLSHAYHPVSRFPNMHIRRRTGASVTEIYADFGIPDYLRHSTMIFTRMPTTEEARLLAQSQEQPVLVVQKVDVDMEGRPIAYSDVVWAGERMQFVIDNENPPGESPAR